MLLGKALSATGANAGRLAPSAGLVRVRLAGTVAATVMWLTKGANAMPTAIIETSFCHEDSRVANAISFKASETRIKTDRYECRSVRNEYDPLRACKSKPSLAQDGNRGFLPT